MQNQDESPGSECSSEVIAVALESWESVRLCLKRFLMSVLRK